MKAKFYYDSKTKDLKWVAYDRNPIVLGALEGFE
jgi:hypothetical protein